jgi:hypothetical protein
LYSFYIKINFITIVGKAQAGEAVKTGGQAANMSAQAGVASEVI